jgi:hypothetical protein
MNGRTDMSESQGDMVGRLAKLGGLYGLFFFLQSYGYALGGGSAEAPPTSVFAAVAHGVKHLSHILVPFGSVAWPLTPTLCGILVLYAVSLPRQFRRARDDAAASAVNRWFFSLLAAISLVSAGAVFLLQNDAWLGCFLKVRREPWEPYVEWLAYLGLMALYTLAANRFLGRVFDRLSVAAGRDDTPWSEIAATLCVAWLFLMAFVGSELDGRLDADAGVFLR